MTAASRSALLVDYGGVLTPRVDDSWASFEEEHGMPARTVARMLWAAYDPEAGGDGPIARIERGELDTARFEVELARQLRDAGWEVDADGLVARLFAGMVPAGGVWDLVADVRAAGVPTVLVSNTWGMSGYPMERLEATFDALVFSGELGVRKPDPEIFDHAAGLVGADVERCVLIDDARANVEAAERHGLTGVLHTGDDGATRAAVEAALDL